MCTVHFYAAFRSICAIQTLQVSNRIVNKELHITYLPVNPVKPLARCPFPQTATLMYPNFVFWSFTIWHYLFPKSIPLKLSETSFDFGLHRFTLPLRGRFHSVSHNTLSLQIQLKPHCPYDVTTNPKSFLQSKIGKLRFPWKISNLVTLSIGNILKPYF